MLRNSTFNNIISKLPGISSFLVPKDPSPLALGVTSVRFRWWDPNKVAMRRFGYEDKLAVSGTLPRPMKIKGSEDDEPFARVPGKPYVPKNSWSEKKALFGQNDYIDLLGDGTIHPSEIMYGVPAWLRGFRGNEYMTLLRKRGLFGRALGKGNPDKFKELQKNIKFQYKTLNRKRRVRFCAHR